MGYSFTGYQRLTLSFCLMRKLKAMSSAAAFVFFYKKRQKLIFNKNLIDLTSVKKKSRYSLRSDKCIC